MTSASEARPREQRRAPSSFFSFRTLRSGRLLTTRFFDRSQPARLAAVAPDAVTRQLENPLPMFKRYLNLACGGGEATFAAAAFGLLRFRSDPLRSRILCNWSRRVPLSRAKSSGCASTSQPIVRTYTRDGQTCNRETRNARLEWPMWAKILCM